MVSNGFISFIQLTEGGKDADGNRIKPVSTPTALVECNVKLSQSSYGDYDTGKYKDSSYTVTVQDSFLKALDFTIITQVVLYDANKSELGTYVIIFKQGTRYMKTTKFTI